MQQLEFTSKRGEWGAEDTLDGYITVQSGQDIKNQVTSCSRINWNNHVATSMSVSECGSVLSAT
jgi:hypothetical protein